MFGICLLSSIMLANAQAQEAYEHQTGGFAEGVSCKEAHEDTFSIQLLQKYMFMEEHSAEKLRDFVPSSMGSIFGQQGASRANRTNRSEAAMPWTVDVDKMYDLATSLAAPQSDKFTAHSYQTMYGTFLGPLAKSEYKPKLLEIGLGCTMRYGPGASVKVWRQLLPHAEIWESDVDKACVERSRSKGLLKGINTLVGDQGDQVVLQQWIKDSGGNFDVVIDDGGHRNTQIKASFDALWPAVKPGGLYFLEDLHVGRHEGWDDTGGKMVMSDIIQAWTEQLLIAKNPDPEIAKTGNPASLQWPLPDAVDFILCQREACVVGKSATIASAT